MVLACLAVHSPHCDLCDGPVISSLAPASHSPLAHLPQPIAPDDCNGACWCCGYHVVSRIQQVPVPISTTVADLVPESPSPLAAPSPPIFRPPRRSVSA